MSFGQHQKELDPDKSFSTSGKQVDEMSTPLNPTFI